MNDAYKGVFVEMKNVKINLKKYKTIVFDCDGVILNSNFFKIDSFFRTAKKLGGSDTQARALVDHHLNLGGISRYPKFVWYLEKVLKQPATKAAIQEYLDVFGEDIKQGLMKCEIADGLNEMRQATAQAKWLVVSGADQQEIRDLFVRRDLQTLFDGGLFGAPDNKDTILAREKENANIILPALFIGDSKYDYQSSKRAGLDFVFLSDWTDVPNWQAYTKEHKIHVLRNIKSI